MSKIFVEHALHVVRLQFRTQANSCVLGTASLVMTNSFLLTFERQLDKVKTRLTTLYVVQKLIITATIIDQLKLCKLQ